MKKIFNDGNELVIEWEDNLESDDEGNDICHHDSISGGQCDKCGKSSVEIYEDTYYYE